MESGFAVSPECDHWFLFVFFFSSRRRHTRFDCDWSSDVCSSDLWPSSTGKMTLEFMVKQFLAATDLPWMERHLTWLGATAIEDGVITELACKLDRFPHDDPVNRILWFDFLTYLPDDLLVKVDRATMLASVEARAPFLDREVMELVLPAASHVKVRGLTTKAILKEAARGLVPDEVIHRRKQIGRAHV